MHAVPSPFPPDIWCALAGNCTLQSVASGADMSLQLFVWHGQWPQLHQGASASLLCLEEMKNKKPTKEPPDQPLPTPPAPSAPQHSSINNLSLSPRQRRAALRRGRLGPVGSAGPEFSRGRTGGGWGGRSCAIALANCSVPSVGR